MVSFTKAKIQVCWLRGTTVYYFCHGESKEVLWVTGVHEEVVPGVGYDSVLTTTLLSGVIL